MAITYNPNIPQANDQLSQSQMLILQNFQGITSLIGIDHATFPSMNAGFHNQVTFPVQSPQPTFTAGNIGLYNFLDTKSALNQLFITLQNGSTFPMTAAQLTSNPGYTYLPSGIILQWGYASTPGASFVTYPLAFPHQTFVVFTTPYTSSTSTDTNTIGVPSAYGLTGFNLYIIQRTTVNNPSGTMGSIQWFAVGY